MQQPADRSVGVFTVDRDLTVVSWDDWLVAVTGIEDADACGRSLATLFPALEERRLLARIRQVVDDGIVQVLAPAFHHYLFACPPRVPSAHFHLMQQHVTITPWRRAGAIVGAAVTIEDVTPRLDRERDLAADLRSADEAIRLRATQALAAERVAPATLVDAFHDTSWRVRRAAVHAIAVQPGEEVVAALSEALRAQHRDFSVLNATLSALALAGDDVLPELVALLQAPDADVRIYAALALGHLGSRRAVPALLRALDDAETNVRFHAIEALGRLRVRAAAAPLARIAAHGDFFLGFAALDALADIGDPAATPQVVRLLQHELLGEAAARTLGRLGDEDVIAPLAAALHLPGLPAPVVATALATLHARYAEAFDEGALIADLARTAIDAAAARRLVAALPAADDEELADLVLVLGWLHFDGIADALAQLLAHRTAGPHVIDALVRRGSAGVALLVRELRTGSDAARAAAAAALGRTGSGDAVPALLQVLEEGRPDLTVVATAALGSIGDAAAFEPILALFGHRDAAVRHAAVAALNSLGHPHTARRMRALLEADDPLVRESAARTAGYFGYPECVDAMLRLCSDTHAAPRRVALENIAFFDDERVPRTLHAALCSDAPGVRAAAAQAAAHLPPSQARELLELAFDDADPWVRYSAARAAAQLPGAALVARLVHIVQHDDAPHVRIAAVDALGRTRAAAADAVLVPLATGPDAELAAAAVHALAQIDTAAARAAVRALLASGDTDRCRSALAALGDAGSVAHVIAEVEQIARRSSDAAVARYAIDVLARTATDAAIAALLRLAALPPLRVPCTAALAHAHESVLDALGRGLQAEDAEVRCAVVEALARRKHPRASRLITAAFEDGAPEVRLTAAHALRRMDLRAAQHELTAAARLDTDSDVRRAAQRALAR